LGVENWKQIFELCQKYFDKSLEEYLKKRDEWDKNLLEKEAEFLNKINDEDFLTNIMNDVFNSLNPYDFQALILKILRTLEYDGMLQYSRYDILDYIIINNTALINEFSEIFSDMFFNDVDLFKIYYNDTVSYFFSKIKRYTDKIFSDEDIFEEIKDELAFMSESFIEIYEGEILNYFPRYFEYLTSSKNFRKFINS